MHRHNVIAHASPTRTAGNPGRFGAAIRPRTPNTDGLAMTASLAQWFTIAEAADALGVSVKTIRRRIADGSLDARRIGPRLIRVRLADLDDLGVPIIPDAARR